MVTEKTPENAVWDDASIDKSDDDCPNKQPTDDSSGQEGVPELFDELSESMTTLSTWMSRSRLIVIFLATVGLQLAGSVVTIWMIYLSCFVVGKAVPDYLQQEDISKPWKYVGTVVFYMALAALLVWVIEPLGHFSAMLGMAAWPLNLCVAAVSLAWCCYALYTLAKASSAEQKETKEHEGATITPYQRWSKIQGMTLELTYAGLYIGQVLINTQLFSLKGIEILGICMMVCCCGHIFFEIYEALQHKTKASSAKQDVASESVATTWKRALCCCVLFSVPLWCVPAFQNVWIITMVMAIALWGGAMLRAFSLTAKTDKAHVATKITITVSYFFTGVMAITLFGFVHHLLMMAHMPGPVMLAILPLLVVYILSFLASSHHAFRDDLQSTIEQSDDMMTCFLRYVIAKLSMVCCPSEATTQSDKPPPPPPKDSSWVKIESRGLDRLSDDKTALSRRSPCV
jgi:hypothetical protein